MGEQEPSNGRLLFRFLVGAADLGTDRLFAALRVRDHPGSRGGSERTHATEFWLIGFAVEVPRSLSRAVRSLGTVYGRTFGNWADWAVATLPGRVAKRYARRAADAAERKLEHWEAIGRVEEAEGRRLAEQVIDALVHTVFDEVSASPELQDLIAEQSAGLSRTAIGEFRDRTAEADRQAESAIGRLLHPRRWRRPPAAASPAEAEE